MVALASTLGAANPFRYRSYYYDSETGLYYCNARYYNAEWGRWVSADSPTILANGQNTVNSANLFAYCESNPVMGYDPTGSINWGKQWWIFLSEFGSEAFRILRRTGGGSLWDIPDMLEEADAFVKEVENLVKELANGSITIDFVISFLGRKLWDSLSGNLRYVIKNYRMFGQKYVLSNQQVRDLARRTARAYEEIVRAVYIVKAFIQGAKALVNAVKTYLRGPIKTILTGKTFERNTGKVDNYFSPKKGYNTAKAEFDKIIKKPSDPKPNGALVGDLPGNITVTFYKATSTQGPSIDIYYRSTGRHVKIRY